MHLLKMTSRKNQAKVVEFISYVVSEKVFLMQHLGKMLLLSNYFQKVKHLRPVTKEIKVF